MNAEQLNAIKERAAKATPGQWLVRKHTNGTIDVISVETTEHHEYLSRIELGELEDAEFIAHAREDVPALVAEVERLTTVKHRLNSEIEIYRKQYEGAQIQLNESEVDNERLRKALEFYADRKHYGIWTDASNNCPTTDVLVDDGFRAKEALE